MRKRGKKKKVGLQRKVSSVFNRVSIPQPDGDPQTDGIPVPDGTAGAPPESAQADPLILQSSLMKRLLRSESPSDKAAADRTIEVSSERTTPDQPASPSPPVEKPQRTEEASGDVEPDRPLGVPPKLTAPDHPARQSLPNKEPEQAENISQRVAPSGTSWVPPKLTASDQPASQGSSTRKTGERENVRDKAEPDPTGGGDPQAPTAGKKAVSRISLARKLHQGQNAADTPAPDRTAQAAPVPASAGPQMAEKSASKERHRPEAPPKEVAPSGRRQTPVPAQVGGPSLWKRTRDKLFAPKPGVSPTRQKAMMISVPILAIILVFAFRQVLSTSPRNTKGATVEDAPVVVVVDSGHEIDWQIPEPLPATMRDPTKLSGQSETQSETQSEEPDKTVKTTKSKRIHIGAIVYSHDKPSAVINGRITYVGDVVNGVTILRIGIDGVECEKDGEKWIQRRHR